MNQRFFFSILFTSKNQDIASVVDRDSILDVEKLSIKKYMWIWGVSFLDFPAHPRETWSLRIPTLPDDLDEILHFLMQKKNDAKEGNAHRNDHNIYGI